jgi:ribonuclease HI
MQLAEHNREQLIWLSGHEAIDGKEMADQLAKVGYDQPFLGPEPACGIYMGVAKKAARDAPYSKHWNSLSGLKQAEALIDGPSANKTS